MAHSRYLEAAVQKEKDFVLLAGLLVLVEVVQLTPKTIKVVLVETHHSLDRLPQSVVAVVVLVVVM